MARYRSPLRYPGGKQRLAPFIREILEENELLGGTYVEPYAGGAGVALELLMDGDVSRVFLSDSSRPIYAFWRTLLDDPDGLCRRIRAASLTIDEWKRRREIVRQPDSHDLAELGYSTFYLNRCNRSGVLSGGVIGGLAQKGRWRIDARFPRSELIRRVESIATYAADIHVFNEDAEEFMAGRVSRLRAHRVLVYCDPPYYARSQRLYPDWYSTEDHGRLAAFIQSRVRQQWLVSYDGHPDVVALYKNRRRFTYTVQYSASTPYLGTELFIFSDQLNIPEQSSITAVDRALQDAVF